MLVSNYNRALDPKRNIDSLLKLVDDILEPSELRGRVIGSFRAARNKREDRPLRKHGND